MRAHRSQNWFQDEQIYLRARVALESFADLLRLSAKCHNRCGASELRQTFASKEKFLTLLVPPPLPIVCADVREFDFGFPRGSRDPRCIAPYATFRILVIVRPPRRGYCVPPSFRPGSFSIGSAIPRRLLSSPAPRPSSSSCPSELPPLYPRLPTFRPPPFSRAIPFLRCWTITLSRKAVAAITPAPKLLRHLGASLVLLP